MPLQLSRKLAEQRDIGADPFFSLICEEPPHNAGPFRLDRCHVGGGVDLATNFFKVVAGDPTTTTGPQDYDATGAQDQYGFGMFLPEYLRDWGDCVKRVDRKRAHATILRAFPDPHDRELALSHLARFAYPDDNCTSDFIHFLARLPPHVGYRWLPERLKDWLSAVDTDASCMGGAGKSTRGDAKAFAADWLERARPLWEDSTVEPWPYDLALLLGYWDRTYADATLPRRGDLPP
jgi:hypothetical protein